ncbi:tyrosine-type recombinase/integrase [Spirillospora sp. NPDC050679]
MTGTAVLAPPEQAEAAETDGLLARPEQARVRGRAPITGSTVAELAAALGALLRAGGAEAGTLEATAAWLQSERRTSERTRRGYMVDVAWWLTYLDARGRTPAAAGPVDADLYAAALREAGLAASSRARRLAAVSSWYTYLHRVGAAAANPFAGMERPATDPQATTTRGLSKTELERLLAYAGKYESARTYALLAVLVATGCRVGGVIGADLDGYGHDRGHRVLDLPVKGPDGKTMRMVLPAFACHALDAYLETDRGHQPGPLFATRTGKRLDQPALYRLIQRIATAASLPAAADLSPHSLRHSVATLLLDQGVALHIVQDFLGHADPRTTRIYDRKRNALDRSPAHQIGTLLADGLTGLFTPGV